MISDHVSATCFINIHVLATLSKLSLFTNYLFKGKNLNYTYENPSIQNGFGEMG